MSFKLYSKMLLQMKPYPFFKLLMFVIRMVLGLTLYIYIYFSYLYRNFKPRSFRRSEYSTDKPEIISFNKSYSRLKLMASYFYGLKGTIRSASKDEGVFNFISQNAKSTLKESDLSFLVKTKTFYSDLKGFEETFPNEIQTRTELIDNFTSTELHRFKTQTAVSSLYSLYGYNQAFNSLANRNIEEEMQTDLFRSKKVL